MCGVVCIASLDGRPVDAELVRRMTAALAHRGPDGDGLLVAGDGPEGVPPVVLGHRRLAIVDLSDRASQPMTRGGVSLTYNGEVYNYLELRAELEALGHSLETAGDTEVLLEAYRQWGVECLTRLNGIFAFVIWDENERRLLAARDRLGVKPLYWASARGCLLIASEMRALKLALGRTGVNEGLVYDFPVNGRLDHSDDTFFEGIHRLPAASWLELRAGAWSVKPYWRLVPNEGRYDRSFGQNAEEFGALFRDSVRLEMRADVPVACCLSGGLDSSAIAAVASELTPTPMSMFTARYRHAAADEWEYATALHAERDVVPVPVFAETGEFWMDLDAVVQAQEEPFGGPGVFAQWRLMKEIRAKGIKVVLDGQGGDELLCGYAKYFYFRIMDLVREGRPFRAAAAALSGVAAGGPQLLNLSGAGRYLPGSWWLDRQKDALLQPDFVARCQDREVAHPQGSVVDQQVLDLTRLGLPALLRYEDKNSMAHGVESRVPFLDHRLVEFALSVPVAHKIRGGLAKLLAREALKGTLPEVIRRRRSKLGYGGAWHSWVQALRPDLDRWLNEPRLAVDRFVRRDALRDRLRRDDPAIFASLILDRWLGLERRPL